MPSHDLPSLWQHTAAAGALPRRFLLDERKRLTLDSLERATTLGERREELRGASVMVLTESQLATAVALLELDGVARRVMLCPPDLDPQHLPMVLATGEVTAAVVSDHAPANVETAGARRFVIGDPAAPCIRTGASLPTEWILFTSGTTGRPKMVVHTLRTLTGAISPVAVPNAGDTVWSTFYDIRRYGGLQILLRALVGGGSMVLSNRHEPAGAFLERTAAAAVSHISGTPSHWRRAVLSPSAVAFSPRYVRLSGETTDQAILDTLHEVFPRAQVAHAFASTEAGVAFDVGDLRSGFPRDVIGSSHRDVELRVQDGTLRIRSPRTALRYLGDDAAPLADPEGFVDTKDVVELRDDRYYFVGRRDGVINVGGLKVHPEEVEAVINRHPSVHLSLVKSRRSPIVGAIVVADVVAIVPTSDRAAAKALETEILETCRDALPWYKVPAAIRFVPSLAVSPAGKLARVGA